MKVRSVAVAGHFYSDEAERGATVDGRLTAVRAAPGWAGQGLPSMGRACAQGAYGRRRLCMTSVSTSKPSVTGCTAGRVRSRGARVAA
jgi:hypothetical protein